MIGAGVEKTEMEFKVIFPSLTGTVLGEVYDARSHAARSAFIFFSGDDSGDIFVDSSGVFALVGFPVGNYRFSCASPNRDYIGYEEDVILYSTDTLQLEFPLLAAGRIHFLQGKKDIDSSYRSVLDCIGLYLSQNPKLVLQVNGHTDNTRIVTEAFRSNLALSVARTEEVKQYLVRKFKFPDERFITRGFGETEPIAGNETEEGKAENRRVEFKLIAAREKR